jgi:hypothetical protein
VKLYSDFAPLSLYFEIIRDDKSVLNGGFTFHAPQDSFGCGSAPTFSACIDLERTIGWSYYYVSA